MNENIDLTKILKDCPKGWEFYSSVYGEVQFVGIAPKIPIKCQAREDEWFGQEILMQKQPIRFEAHGETHSVSSAGEHRMGVGECTFFPSREQRDWSKFSAPWCKKERFDPKTLKAFDRVLVRDIDVEHWMCGLFSHIVNDEYLCIGSCYKHCIPYNDETKHLVGTKEEAPEYYRYWEE